jgi:putative PIN family toxin of toxin-antitoxin system
MRLVLDTNVLVSAIAFGGPPRDVLQTVVTGAHRLVLSPAILDGLHRVLIGSKFRYSVAVADHIDAELREIAEIVEPGTRLSVITRDPEDNRVLECAVEGGAEVIVSGDRDLLAVGRYVGIPVCRPQEFLALDR